MSKKTINIWNREFQLPIAYMCDSDETVTQIQKEAEQRFFEKASEILSDAGEIKRFCLKNNGADIKENEITNIFKYVMPVEIFVLRCEDKREVAIMCNYRFDMEHGLAVIFENEELVNIISQDQII